VFVLNWLLMKFSARALAVTSILLAALVSASCGGGGGSDNNSSPESNLRPNTSQEAGAPAATGITAADGFAWINFRRTATGLTPFAFSTEIARAAQNHSDYQRINGPFPSSSSSGSPITHSEIAGEAGFTGVDACPNRITYAGFSLGEQYACGEVISALTDSSGFTAAEELIAAIYHRFLIFQPSFKEAGSGSAPSYNGRYTIFTQNFAVRGSFTGLGNGAVVNYPYNSQKLVPTRFAHSTERPDPLPESLYPQYANKAVGYPISVHADLNQRIDVNTFTVRKRGDSSALSGRVLSGAADANTPFFSAAIVPFLELESNSTYEVQFSGTVCNTDNCANSSVPVSRNWSFTTR